MTLIKPCFYGRELVGTGCPGQRGGIGEKARQ